MPFSILLLLFSPMASAMLPDWSEYNRVLERYVTAAPDNGARVNLVRYSRLARNQAFRSVVSTVENFPLNKLETDDEKLSFYINAYNILAIKTVLDNWPVKSIKSIGNLLHPVWEKEVGMLGGKPVSLDDILHKILRPMGEPRVHFAVNCASRGCPEIRREAFTPKNLDQQLDDQVVKFLKIRNGFRLLPKKNSVRIAKQFRWYRDDFKEMGGVPVFLRRYVDIPEDYKFRPNITYDWDLNGK